MRSTTTQEIISIKDERLDIDRIGQYRLSFFISEDACEISIFDIQKKQLLLFENRPFDQELNTVENLQAIYDDHILVPAGFWKEIHVFFRNKKFSLIPFPVFDKKHLSAYVRLNEPTDPNTDDYHFKILDELGMTVAFGYPAAVKDWFKTSYPRTALYFNHQSIAYLNGIKNQLRTKANNSLYMSLNASGVQIAGFNLSRLAIYNQFHFSEAKQLVKLALLTAQQFSDAGQAIPLLVHGTKDQVEAYMPTLRKFFSNVELGQRPSGLMIHPVFNELESYEYFDVLSNL
ncbi:DUF3822 family protein [Roseivirga misakiensis]|uniref:DUF3822 domain-containing protein n=1 Tax=Roseivirga misakiensis TaxID=1563681 RepID=A0A1E5SKL9_9BACT|nr:DUF3822 family protein [Roseivirga misakiensis]OEJ99669.1 hypothetical protein BFP71_08855 [Roseivirga misakiensis]